MVLLASGSFVGFIRFKKIGNCMFKTVLAVLIECLVIFWNFRHFCHTFDGQNTIKQSNNETCTDYDEDIAVKSDVCSIKTAIIVLFMLTLLFELSVSNRASY